MINAFILGIIEGITEFLPISSTAHLILFSKILNIPQTDFHKFFEVFIQSGAILAVIFSYFKFLASNKKIIKNLLFSFIPTALISIIFYKLIKNFFFENEILIISMLVFIGIVFVLIEIFIKKEFLQLKYTLDNLNPSKAVFIGLIQALAIIPGVSRAGAVILGMLFLGFKRKEAVIYSFLLAIPTIISAGIYDLSKTGIQEVIFKSQNFIYLLIGFLTSFIFATLTIKWFVNYLQKNNLAIFGYYRILLGIIFILSL